MPLLRNKHQPYFPDPDSPNNYVCGSEQYCHPIALGDTIYSQFYQTPCGASEITDPEFEDVTLGAELLTNGGFTGNANGWQAGLVPSNLPAENWAYGTDSITHSAGNDLPVYQLGLTLNSGELHRVEITFTRTAGYIYVQLGDGVGSTATPIMEETGTYTYDIYFYDTLDPNIYIFPSSDFVGEIDSISLKQVSYNSWNPNEGWTFANGQACHVVGETGTLEETVANYINGNDYYLIKVNASGVSAGSCRVYVSDALVGEITADGTYTYYGTPTIAGVLSFIPTSDFNGCIDFLPQGIDLEPGLYLLKNFHEADVVAPDGTRYDISSYIDYYEDYVTLFLNIDELEIPYGCYTIEVTDTCDEVETTYTSECLNYQFEHPRTKMITAYCDQPAFGFEFENTGFRLQQRVVCRSINPNYPKTKQIQRNGNGSARVVYSEVEKFWQLHTAYTTETFHDAMSIMVDCDHFAIGEDENTTIEYIAEVEDYTPQWTANGSYSLAPVVVNLRVKDGGQKFNRHT